MPILSLLSECSPFTAVLLFLTFNLCFISFLFLRRTFPGRRLLLLCSIASLAALVAATMTPPEAEAQRVVTVTVYVTVVQTMLVQVPVTVYVTVSQMITSFLTFAKTDVSISVRLMTMWRTVTSVATQAGMLGPVPSNFFGSYSDLGLMGTGAITGAVAALTITKFLSHRPFLRTGEDPEPPPDSRIRSSENPEPPPPKPPGMTSFQGKVVDALSEQDEANQSYLDQVITAANATSSGTSDATVDDPKMKDKGSDLSGTGGVALLEYAKDQIQTAVSNISGVGAQQIAARKVVERKMAGEEGQEDEEGEEEENEDEG